MSESRIHWSRKAVRVAIASALGGILAAVVILILPIRPEARPEPAAPVPETAAAMQYAHAFQEGDWDFVIDHTLWMKERLDFERSRGAGPDHVREARLELSRLVSDRTAPGNRLLHRGIEDQYVFRPEATLDLLGVGEGRADLEQPATACAWIRVSFPAENKAPLDEAGFPVRAVTVGVHTTADGCVLKAGVEGNLEIDWDSLTYWPGAHGKD